MRSPITASPVQATSVAKMSTLTVASLLATDRRPMSAIVVTDPAAATIVAMVKAE